MRKREEAIIDTGRKSIDLDKRNHSKHNVQILNQFLEKLKESSFDKNNNRLEHNTDLLVSLRNVIERYLPESQDQYRSFLVGLGLSIGISQELDLSGSRITVAGRIVTYIINNYRANKNILTSFSKFITNFRAYVSSYEENDS